MKRVIAGIKFTIDDSDTEIASYRHGEDENSPVYERTTLFETRGGDYYLLGGGGSLTLWWAQKGRVRDFDCGRIPVSFDDAVAWVRRITPRLVH
jgi:hypothetical protein